MTAYIVRRALLIVPTVFGVSALLFLVVHFSPGGPAQVFCGDICTAAERKTVAKELGLDRPYHVQYLEWLGRVARGDFGRSFVTHVAVGTELRQKLPITIELGLLALLISISLSIPLGVVAALKQDSIWDYGVRSVSIGMLAIPKIALVAIALGARYGVWTPPLNYVSPRADLAGNLRIIGPPAILLGIASAGIQMRLVRANMLDVLRRDYIRTATAKGLPGRIVTIRHALKNALLPSITLIGGQVSVLIGGTVILETLFNIPGMGR